MLPYFIVISFILIWMALEKHSIHRKSFWVPLLTLSLFSGLRSHRVGTDSWSYTRDFRNNLNIYNFNFNPNVELGYQVFEYILLRLTHNYFWLFFLTSLFIVWCHLKVARDYSRNYILSILFYFTLSSYTFFFNGLRQGIAMAFIALSTPYIIRKDTFKFFLLILIASLFHKTALFIIPFYILLHLRIQLKYKLLITFLSSLILSRLVIKILASENQRYEIYTKESENAGGFLILAFYILIGLSLYMLNHLYKVKDEIYHKLLTFYLLGMAFMIPIAMLKTNPSGPQRLIYYFTWALMLLIPTILQKINSRLVYTMSIALALIYFYMTTSRFGSLAPYTLNPIFKVL